MKQNIRIILLTLLVVFLLGVAYGFIRGGEIGIRTQGQVIEVHGDSITMLIRQDEYSLNTEDNIHNLDLQIGEVYKVESKVVNYQFWFYTYRSKYDWKIVEEYRSPSEW